MSVGLLLMVAASGTALAQATPDANSVSVPAIDAQLYRVPVDAQRTLWTDDAGVAPDGHWMGKLGFNYAKDPLVYRFTDGTEYSVLGSAAQANLIGAVTYARVRIGLDVPLWLATGGDLSNAAGAGLGDLALDIKGTLLDRDEAALGLALGGRLGLPTATVDAPVGTDGVGWSLQVIADKELGPVLVAANLGTQGVPPAPLEGVEWDDQFFYRVGAGYSLEENDRYGLSADFAGRLVYGAGDPAGRPLEGLFGGWNRFGDDWVLRAGAGTGLTAGVGAPDFRAVLTFGYEPPLTRDSDGDGIVDRDDACPDVAEDPDGWMDTDGCPDDTTQVTVVVQNSKLENVLDTVTVVGTHAGEVSGGSEMTVDLHPGTWPLRATAPQYADHDETITVPEGDSFQVVVTLDPLFGEVKLVVTDLEGNALDASARDDDGTLHDARGGSGFFQLDAGEQSLMIQSSGFSPRRVPIDVPPGEVTELVVKLAPARAKVTKKKIEILDKVFFDTGKATIKPESFSLLDDVAALLDANPDIKKIRVEGHTDSRGSARTNLQLSQDRSESVKQYLVDKGIDAGRLEAVGYGEEKPLDPASNSKAFDKNRRVEFNILERD